MKGTAIIVNDNIVVEWDSDSLDPKPWREMLRLIQSLDDAKFVQRPEAHWELPASPYHAAALIAALSSHKDIFIEEGIHDLNSLHDTIMDLARDGDGWDLKEWSYLRQYQQAALGFSELLDHRVVIADD